MTVQQGDSWDEGSVAEPAAPGINIPEMIANQIFTTISEKLERC